MTTPTPPGGNLPPPLSPNLGNLLGGASGSLGGTNILQGSLDRLTNAVSNLTNRIGGAGGLGGNATTQQNGGNGFAAAAARFPRMVNPFRLNQVQAGGIGGAGGPNTGNANITPTQTFGQMGYNQSGPSMMLGAVATFGQNMMMNQLALNQYATTSMVGMNRGGRGFNQSMQMLYRQVGATPGYLNGLAMSPTDAYAMAAPLQQLGGTQLFNQSALGRAGLGAAAGFGMSNPTLGAQTSAQLAAALYSPSFSLNMLRLGYNPIRSMSPGGAPMNAGQAARSILTGMGLNNMSSARVFGNLSSGVGQANLSALFGPSGIPNQQAQQFLQTYAQLFSKGLNPTQASSLISKATFGSTSSMKSAQSRLNSLGVATSANDIQALKNAQAVTTGRQGEYAGGFNDAISQSTGLLEDFNNALNKLLKGPLGTAAGYTGGTAGVLSGTAHGAGLGFGIGGAMTLTRLMGRFAGLGGAAGGAGAGAGGAGAAGAAGAGGIGAMAAAAVPIAAGLVLGAAMRALGDKLSPKGTVRGAASEYAQKMGASGVSSGLISWGVSKVAGLLHIGGMGGGAAAPGSQQQKGNNNRQIGGGISGAARSAVGAAKTQLGVPYVYGDEIPGVGFDCSGLVQWAYKQAGVNLPRTSQSMWSALKNKRVGLNAVQEGDLLFTAGSDGSASSPGHVAMMVSNNQLIQAPHTGANVELTGYNPHDWVAAARPSGRGTFVSGGSGSGPGVSGTGTGSSSLFAGNRGLGMGGAGNYGSANEVDIISAMGAGGGMGGSFIGGSGGNGGSTTSNSNGSSGKAGSTAKITGGGSIAANKKLMQQMAQAMYGWGKGAQWRALDTLEMHEAGYNQFAQNPNSTAYGIGQFLDSTWKGYGNKTSNPKLQIQYMLEYIHGRYGSPVKAWNQYYDHPGGIGWYGAGGTLKPGMSIVGERGPELAINSGGQTQIFSNAQTNYLLNAIKGNVSQSPWKSDITQGSSHSSRGGGINIHFNQGSIVLNHSGSSHESIASKAGREVARQIVHHINHDAVHQAIRNGEKL